LIYKRGELTVNLGSSNTPFVLVSASDFIKKMNRLKYQEQAKDLLQNFAKTQESFVNKQELFNFLSIISESISLKRGHDKVMPKDTKTALVFYYTLSHCSNIDKYIQGDKTIIYKHAEADPVLPEEVQLTLPALKRFKVIKTRLASLLDKRSMGKQEELEASILTLARLISREKEISRKTLDSSYNLLRILLFRTPLEEFDAANDFFHLLTSRKLFKMNTVKIQKKLEIRFMDTFHHIEGKRLAKDNIFPTLELERIGITKYPINTLFVTMAQLHGLRRNVDQVTVDDYNDVMEHFERLLSKFDFERRYYSIRPFCSMKKLYENAFNYGFKDDAKELIFRIRRSLTNSMINIVGKREFLFSHSNLVAKIITNIVTLSAIASYRRIENHSDITVRDVKQGIRAFYFLLREH